MKNGYLITGVRFRLLHKLIVTNPCSCRPRYFFRYLLLLQNSLWSSFFTRRERAIYGDYIREQPLPDNMVFIVGHWRTGSTYLHKLMSLDPQLAAPTLYQTSLPEGFITARPFYEPIMKKLIGQFRPFDNMKAGIDEPQECEFAFFRMCGESPLKHLMFPSSEHYFLLDEKVNFLPDGKAGEHFQQSVRDFYTKLARVNHGRRLVVKNPFHSLRISYLHKQFPNARFIHIHRDPYEVIPSTIRMWSVVGSQNTMNSRWKAPVIQEVSDFFCKMLKNIRTQMAELPKGTGTDISYSELIADPKAALSKAYESIGLEYTESFNQAMQDFLRANSDYEKNTYTLKSEEKQAIAEALSAHGL
jgi:hypothetical protein